MSCRDTRKILPFGIRAWELGEYYNQISVKVADRLGDTNATPRKYYPLALRLVRVAAELGENPVGKEFDTLLDIACQGD